MKGFFKTALLLIVLLVLSVALCSCLGGDNPPPEAPLHVHTPSDAVFENRVEATCVREGSYDEVVYCSECKQEVSRTQKTVDKLPHSETENIEAKAPTCTEEGYTAYSVCKSCNAEVTPKTVLTPLGHSTVTHEAKAATCTENGNNEYLTCERCDYTTIEVISASGHTLTTYPAKLPTCTEDGYSSYEACANCDYSTAITLSAFGHSKVKHSGKSPTCTEPGYKAYETCTKCSYTTYQTLSPTGHAMLSRSFAATCQQYAYTRYNCNNCDYSYSVIGEQIYGVHKNIAGQTLDCTYSITDRVCATCNKTVPGGNHAPTATFSVATMVSCENDGLMVKTCVVCNAVTERQILVKRGHSFTTYETTLAPDVYLEGYDTALCDNGCGKTDVRKREALDGIKFTYTLDKESYKAGDTVVITVDMRTQNATLNSILVALLYNSNEITFVSGELKVSGELFKDVTIGGNNSRGRLSLYAKANTFLEPSVNVDLADGVSRFAVLYFKVNSDVSDISSISITVKDSGDQSSSVIDKDGNSTIDAYFGSVPEIVIEKKEELIP